MTTAPIPAHSDSPEARRYNRTRRWLDVADFAVGFVFLVILLATGWSDSLRDLAYRMGFQSYTLSLLAYIVLLLGISKVLGLGLEYYGFRLDRRFKLSNQRFGFWLWDETKSFLVSLVLGAVVIELLYFTIREWPQNWWLLAWALFMVLFVLLAQLAPVILFPIFYKFEPLEDEDCRRRARRPMLPSRGSAERAASSLQIRCSTTIRLTRSRPSWPTSSDITFTAIS